MKSILTTAINIKLNMTSSINTNTDIIFGDFTSDDSTFINSTSKTKTNVNNYSHLTTTIVFHSPIFVIFGDFTPEECSNYQSGTMSPSHQQPQHVTSQSPQAYSHYYYDFPCQRCGYHSHKIENCVARRNRWGELIEFRTPLKKKNIMFPVSPKSAYNSPVYYNHHLSLTGWCQSDKTNYNDFVFSDEEIKEWEDEDKINPNPSLTECDTFMSIHRDQDIQRMMINQMITDYMLYSFN